MRIGVDIDAVLANLLAPLDEFHNKKYGTNVTARHHTTYDLGKVWSCSWDESINRMYEFYFSEEFHEIKHISGSKKGIKTLAAHHDLFVITSRPYEIEDRSNRWIYKHFANKFKETFHTNQMTNKKEQSSKKKSDICIEQNITVLIEDYLGHANDCAEKGIKVILLSAPWNKAEKNLHPNITRVSSWKQIPSLISEI